MRERGRRRVGEGSGLCIRRCDVERHIHLKAFRSGNFREGLETVLLQERFKQEGNLRAGGERCTFARIEIEDDSVRPIEMAGAMKKRVKLKAGNIRAPDEGRQIVDADVADGFAAGDAWDVRGVYLAGREFGRILFIEGLSAYPVGEAAEGHGTLFEVGQQPRGDADVIVDYLRLRESVTSVENLVQIRQGDRASFDFDRLLRSHGVIVAFRLPEAGAGSRVASNELEKVMPAKRQLVEPHKGEKRYVRRDEQGQFTDSQDNVSRSLSADRRRHAATTAPKGQGDRGDQKRP